MPRRGREMRELFIVRIDSAVGTLLLVSDGESLCALDYPGCEQRMRALLRRRYGELRLRDAVDPQGFSSRIRAYFAGDLGCLNGIPVNPGGTAFQQQAWSALRTIPPGAVWSYGGMAAPLGRTAAYRAVGLGQPLQPPALVLPRPTLGGAGG